MVCTKVKKARKTQYSQDFVVRNDISSGLFGTVQYGTVPHDEAHNIIPTKKNKNM